MIRQDAKLPISRFVELIDIPRRTYHYRLAKHRAGLAAKGPWPAPVVDVIEPSVAKYAGDWPAWGHRKIWALMAHDAHPHAASMSSVRRAMARRGLLQPVRYQAERRQLAQARRAVFVDPPTRRNRVWQMDFSEFESSAGGIWRIGGVVDYVAKPALTCRVATTQTATDMIAALDAAVDEAETLLGCSLVDECVDAETGEIEPIAVVTDNGPAMRSVAVARWFAARPHFVHVRTRHKSPQTNGAIERFFGSLKYEHLYRQDIADGDQLAIEVESFRDVYNRIRPHEHLDWHRPADVYLDDPTNPQILKLSSPESEQGT
jgi:putative transposase